MADAKGAEGAGRFDARFDDYMETVLAAVRAVEAIDMSVYFCAHWSEDGGRDDREVELRRDCNAFSEARGALKRHSMDDRQEYHLRLSEARDNVRDHRKIIVRGIPHLCFFQGAEALLNTLFAGITTRYLDGEILAELVPRTINESFRAETPHREPADLQRWCAEFGKWLIKQFDMSPRTLRLELERERRRVRRYRAEQGDVVDTASAESPEVPPLPDMPDKVKDVWEKLQLEFQKTNRFVSQLTLKQRRAGGSQQVKDGVDWLDDHGLVERGPKGKGVRPIPQYQLPGKERSGNNKVANRE